MPNFSLTYWTPKKGWWANYRWHITEPSEKLGLKSEGWKKSFFRRGRQNKVLEIEGIENAKKCLQGLRNGTITAFGGRFRGASYDKNAERVVKQAKISLKNAIENYDKGESMKVEETVIVPNSYYNWWAITSISGGVVTIMLGLVGVIWFKAKKEKKRV